MTHGIYTLRKNVSNPMKNSCHESGWKHRDLFRKRTMFVVAPNLADRALLSLGMKVSNLWTYEDFEEIRPLVDALSPHLELQDPMSSLGTLILYHQRVLLKNVSHQILLRKLVDGKIVTLETVDGVIRSSC